MVRFPGIPKVRLRLFEVAVAGNQGTIVGEDAAAGTQPFVELRARGVEALFAAIGRGGHFLHSLLFAGRLMAELRSSAEVSRFVATWSQFAGNRRCEVSGSERIYSAGLRHCRLELGRRERLQKHFDTGRPVMN